MPKGMYTKSRDGMQPGRNMGRAAPVNPAVSSPGISTAGGRLVADFGKAGANVVRGRAPGNYKAGKKM